LARKILLADDSVTAQNMGRKILADAGYEVIAVNNGSAALKKIAELKPDLVILDVYMPGYSGLEVCQRLKESQETARIPVLLTVGKLEPFKPEEAQRVRAEGYIVKPFEASELLSALSKLEDKVVPRAEPSKPGRFARAIAAAEESGRVRGTETSGSDSGWKSRIGFPHEKTESEQKVEDRPSTYNPVNRDLRTVVETSEEKAEYKKKQEVEREAEASVDVAALAASGLPQGVTAEEVAAMTAAAAQMQMASAAFKDEYQASETTSHQVLSPVLDKVGYDPVPELQGDAAAPLGEEAKTVTPRGSKEESRGEGVASESAALVVHRRRKDDERPEETQDVPVTMAATAESVAAASMSASRWTAVAVALESEETAISLDQEMQKANTAAEPESAAVAVTTEEKIAPGENSSDPASSGNAQVEAISSEPVSVPQPEPVMSVETTQAESAPVAQWETPAVTSSLATAEGPSLDEPANASIEQPETAVVAPVTADSTQFAKEESSPVASFVEPNQAPVDEFEGRAFVNSAFANQTAETGVASPDPAGAQELQAAPIAEAAEAMPLSGAPEPIRDAEQAEPKLDNEAVKSTAAAWASWRQIRDTSKSPDAVQPHPREFDAPESAPSETTAMAAAAGAEQILQAAAAAIEPNRNPADVASIVDSVLADLRPKLMEEISRKMSEKK
jgi:CheY-like chemotaxis protein